MHAFTDKSKTVVNIE